MVGMMRGRDDQASGWDDTMLREQKSPLLRPRAGLRAVIIVGLALLLAGAATAFAVLGLDAWGTRGTSINPDEFADGLGIYLFNDGKYNLLVWKKKIVAAPGSVPEPNDIAEATREAIIVAPKVRFFAYGLDFSQWPVVPPYEMAFCIVRNERTIDGIFPVRIKPIDRARGPIYELLLPPVADTLKGGNVPYLFWVLNYQYSCNDGWTFKFSRNP
jgi:hypothetical protein